MPNWMGAVGKLRRLRGLVAGEETLGKLRSVGRALKSEEGGFLRLGPEGASLHGGRTMEFGGPLRPPVVTKPGGIAGTIAGRPLRAPLAKGGKTITGAGARGGVLMEHAGDRMRLAAMKSRAFESGRLESGVQQTSGMGSRALRPPLAGAPVTRPMQFGGPLRPPTVGSAAGPVRPPIARAGKVVTGGGLATDAASRLRTAAMKSRGMGVKMPPVKPVTEHLPGTGRMEFAGVPGGAGGGTIGGPLKPPVGAPGMSRSGMALHNLRGLGRRFGAKAGIGAGALVGAGIMGGMARRGAERRRRAGY